MDAGPRTHPKFDILAGGLGLAGCAAALVSSVAGVAIVSGVGFFGGTISDVAAGRHAWIQDLGLYAFALGMAAVAVALLLRPGATLRWRLGGMGLVLVAAVIAVIAAHGEYGDRDPGGLVVHTELVSVMGVLFFLATLLLARGMRAFAVWFSYASLAIGVVWMLTGPAIFFVPDAWEGLYERLVALLLVGWLAGVSALLIRARGRV